MSFGDGFLMLITFLIYTPRTIEITCAARSASAPSKVRLHFDESDTIQAVEVLKAKQWTLHTKGVGKNKVVTTEVR